MSPPYPLLHLLSPFHRFIYFNITLYHPLVLTDHPHIFAFPALAFLSRPHLLAVFIYVSLIKTPGLGSKLLIDTNISPLRDQLELLPETIDIERYQYENMKIVLFRMMQ